MNIFSWFKQRKNKIKTAMILRKRREYAQILRLIRNTDNLGRMKYFLASIGDWKNISYGVGYIKKVEVEMHGGYTFSVYGGIFTQNLMPNIALMMIVHLVRVNNLIIKKAPQFKMEIK